MKSISKAAIARARRLPAERAIARSATAIVAGDETGYFDDLGKSVSRTWEARSFDEQAFAGLAADALAARPPERFVDPVELLCAYQREPDVPQMDPDAQFGQPPITVFYHPRFHIDVYYWMDGTTAIHQHRFSGAFHVLAGSSVHGSYTFRPRWAVNSALQLGDLTSDSIDLLQTGATRPIHAGARFIHSLFHLDRPSCTVVIRTRNELTSGPAYTYLPPHLAEASALMRNAGAQRASLILLRELDPKRFAATVARVAAEGSFADIYRLASELDQLGASESLAEVLQRAHARFAEPVEQLGRVFEERRHLQRLVRLRKTVTNAEHRFFLALLLNAPTRAQVLSLVRRWHPAASPVRTVMRWLAELAQAPAAAPNGPNALGLQLSESERHLVELGLRGLGDAEILARLAKRYGAAEVQQRAPEIRAFRETLGRSSLFRRLMEPTRLAD
jgi:hypothetical protein